MFTYIYQNLFNIFLFYNIKLCTNLTYSMIIFNLSILSITFINISTKNRYPMNKTTIIIITALITILGFSWINKVTNDNITKGLEKACDYISLF